MNKNLAINWILVVLSLFVFPAVAISQYDHISRSVSHTENTVGHFVAWGNVFKDSLLCIIMDLAVGVKSQCVRPNMPYFDVQAWHSGHMQMFETHTNTGGKCNFQVGGPFCYEKTESTISHSAGSLQRERSM